MPSQNSTSVPTPRLMGVLNITPDSFSDGGHFNSVESALAKAKQLIAEGASVVDVGGESTRPGAARLTPAQEQARVLPVIRELVLLPEIADGSVALSIDTLNASTASLAVAAGVSIVNDVAGGQADPQMLAAVAELMGNPSTNGKPISYVLGHWANFAEGAAAVQQTADIVASVVVELAASVASAEAAGVIRNQIVLDPGLGFGKDAAQNWQLLDGFDALAGLGMPILIGASRKRFITARVAELRGTDPADVTISERDDATAALSEKLWNRAVESQNAQQLWGFRVHNVQANFDSLRAAAALRFADSASDLQS